MCLIFIAWRAHPDYPCVIAANRDEFFARPSAAMSFWNDQPQLLAGRDLRAGGTWMGVDRKGKFAALTNFREPGSNKPEAPSRGALVSDFLKGDLGAEEYWKSICDKTSAYNGFNLLCGKMDEELWHFSNRGTAQGQALSPGIYGVSNHLLDTPWPKVAQGKSRLADALQSLPAEAELFHLLHDETIYDDSALPRTGVNLEWERLLSAAFVRSSNYGTCSSTVVTLDKLGILTADEISFTPAAQPAGHNRFRLSLE